MNKGSCLCGAVKYEITGALGPIIYCHCSRCRKATGSAFAAVSPVATTDFRIAKGQESLRSYSTDAGIHRVFCGKCGSPIISKRDSAPDIVRVRIGTLDSPLTTKVSAHVFTASKAEWHDIHDGASQHAERP